MIVKVLAFGIVKDIFGGSLVEVELAEESAVNDLKLLLERKYPRLRELGSFMIAVNNEYAPANGSIDKNDEIAIIPPVSGG